MTILLTRPIEDATTFAQALEFNGVECMIEPMLNIEMVDGANEEFKKLDLDDYQAIVTTSRHALKALDVEKGTRIIHVGNAGGSVESLIEFIHTTVNPADGPLLYCRGQHIRADLVSALPKFQIDELITYYSVKSTQFSEAALQAFKDGNIKGVVFFSFRTAEAFLNCIEQANIPGVLSHLKAFCISDTVAGVIEPHPFEAIYICPNTTREGMLDLIQNNCL